MDLPFIDSHSLELRASREAAWQALRQYATHDLRFDPDSAPARLLRTEPAVGFSIGEERPPTELVLTGRHRFSTYRLVFSLEDAAPGRTRLVAKSYGVFPGALGRLYRALVIGSQGHKLVVRRMLRTVGERVETGD